MIVLRRRSGPTRYVWHAATARRHGSRRDSERTGSDALRGGTIPSTERRGSRRPSSAAGWGSASAPSPNGRPQPEARLAAAIRGQRRPQHRASGHKCGRTRRAIPSAAMAQRADATRDQPLQSVRYRTAIRRRASATWPETCRSGSARSSSAPHACRRLMNAGTRSRGSAKDDAWRVAVRSAVGTRRCVRTSRATSMTPCATCVSGVSGAAGIQQCRNLTHGSAPSTPDSRNRVPPPRSIAPPSVVREWSSLARPDPMRLRDVSEHDRNVDPVVRPAAVDLASGTPRTCRRRRRRRAGA